MNIQGLEVNGPSWMYDLRSKIGDRTLLEVEIPGTHDAATDAIPKKYYDFKDDPTLSGILDGLAPDWWKSLGNVEKAIAWGYIYKIARTQGHGFLQQLQDGNRFIDLRIDKSGNFVHNWVPTTDTMAGFLKSALHPFYFDKDSTSTHEIVILSMLHLHRYLDTTLTDVAGAIETSLGADAMLAPYDLTSKTLNDLWSDKGRVILIVPNSSTTKQARDKYKWLWTEDDLEDSWNSGNTLEWSTLQAQMNKGITDYLGSGRKKFFILNCAATPDVKSYDDFQKVAGIVGDGLFDYEAKNINPEAIGFIANQAKLLNLLKVDAYTHGISGGNTFIQQTWVDNATKQPV